jgi:peptidoglycan/LPS O-acetylase OafA/YrhL
MSRELSPTLDNLGEGLQLAPTPLDDPSLLRRFRPDIEGLRAVAVILVVLYHAGVPFLAGGYVGVDVFFVISGFLITQQLTDPSRGIPSLRGFYARRIRRLLPSAVLVIVVTAIASRVWGPVLQASATARDAVTAVGLIVNYHFAATGLDYQTANASPSPLLHFWSLAIEEQFYLVWPLLVIGVMLLTRTRTPRTRRLALAAAIGGVVLVSFAISVNVTSTDAPLAYFSLQTRAWELGIGGLIALGVPLLARIPSTVAVMMTWTGLALIIVGALVFSDLTPFPGYFASVPVIGTGLLIAGGLRSDRRSTDRILGVRGVRFIGSISYTWYLWHWPVLVLAPAIFGTGFNLADRLAICAISLWFAVITSLLLERPLLRTPLPKVPWYGIAVASALIIALIAATTIIFPPKAPGALAVAANGKTGGAVIPSVEGASKDDPRYPAACILGFTQVTQPSCNVTPSGAIHATARAGRMVLLGDSHAGQWYPVVRSIADKYSQDVEVLNKVGCPIQDIAIFSPELKRNYMECNDWRASMLDRLASEATPGIVFISSLNWYPGGELAMAAGWRDTIKKLAVLRVPVVYLVDTPYPTEDVPTCVAAHLSDWSACNVRRSKSIKADPLEEAIVAGTYPNVFAVDMNPTLCPGAGPTCPVVSSGTMLYRDNSHLTNTAASLLTPAVEKKLRALGVLQ